MNAYELAEGLEQFSDLGGKFFGECANILRQQADRIAELEKGEEVAGRFYWESVVDGHVMAVPSEGTPHYNKDDFPLYTTPQIKELSDEEIYQEMIKCIDSPDDGHEFRYKDFARAILKKASEK